MNKLIERAKDTIRTWSSDDPRDLAFAVAALCREILDDGEMPIEGLDWMRLRQAFDIVEGQSIASTIALWDDLCCLGDSTYISNHDAFVKIGIVTWTVKSLLKKLGMLSGPRQEIGLEEWKVKLIKCLDRAHPPKRSATDHAIIST